MKAKQIKCFKFKIEFEQYKSNKNNTLINYDGFFDYLIKATTNDCLVFDKKRKLIIKDINNQNDFICGILLSFKNHKSYTQYNNNISTRIIKNGVDYIFLF